MKRILLYFFVSMLAVMSVSCGKIVDVSVRDYSIVSLKPTSRTSVSATLRFGVYNKGLELRFRDIKGSLAYLDNAERMNVGHFTAAPCIVPKGENNVYLDVDIRLDEDLSLVKVLTLAQNFQLEKCVVDVSGVAEAAKVSKKLEYKEMPLKDFVERSKKDKTDNE